MCCAIAVAIRMSFCGVLKTHARFASIGSTIVAAAAIEIIGVVRFGGDIDHRERVRHDGRADQRVDVVFARQLARVLDGLRGIGGVVEDDVLNLLPRDFLRQ